VQVTSVAFAKDGKQVFSGCLDSNIHCWDLRRGKVQHVLRGHRDMVTGLSLSPDGNFLLSNATDNSLRMCVPSFLRTHARAACIHSSLRPRPLPLLSAPRLRCDVAFVVGPL
jgi:hypothetical protein